MSDEEAAFVITAGDSLRNAPDEFFKMLKSRYVESQHVRLPLAGEVSIHVIQNEPIPHGEDTTGDIAEALIAFEEFLGLPFPADFVVALVPSVGPDTQIKIHYGNLDPGWRVGGAYSGGYFKVIRPEGGSVSSFVLYHELAHYYINFAHPAWLREGGASFLASLVRDQAGIESLESRKVFLRNQIEPSCLSPETRNIYDLGERGSFLVASPNQQCVYWMGEEFLIELTLSLGLETSSRAWREILLISGSPDQAVPLQTKDVILIWWNNTPPQRRAEFKRLFREMHGGPLSDFDRYFGVADDHGESPSAASDLPMSEWLLSDLGTPFDIDTFRFRAEEGTTYLVAFLHPTIDAKTTSENFYLTMTAADGIPSRLGVHGGGDLGIETTWTARRSGDYYLSVASTVGTLGHYSLLVSPQIHAADDHADDVYGATPLPAGFRAEGYLGHASDADFFYVDALRGYSYEVFVGHRSVQYSTVTYYSPPGTEWEEGLGPYSQGLKGSRNRWHATESGRYYLAVENPFSTPGAFFITVTETPPEGGDHGEGPSSATPVRLGQSIQAELEHSLDQDYFVFRAEADREYRIMIDHDSLNFQPVVILAPDGETQVHEHYPVDRDSKDSYTPWVAAESGYYYLVYRSPDGDTGSYTLTILPAAVGNDDHGDTPRTATEISVDQVVSGSLDHETDFDHFSFQAKNRSKLRNQGKLPAFTDARGSAVAVRARRHDPGGAFRGHRSNPGRQIPRVGGSHRRKTSHRSLEPGGRRRGLHPRGSVRVRPVRHPAAAIPAVPDRQL